MADRPVITRFLFVVAVTVIVALAIILPIVLFNNSPTIISDVAHESPDAEPSADISIPPDASTVFAFSEDDDDVTLDTDLLPQLSPPADDPDLVDLLPEALPDLNNTTTTLAPPTTAAPTITATAAISNETVGAGADQGPHFIAVPHVAHAVPGRHYIADDVDGNNVEFVRLDASRSHSHFFEAEPQPHLAAITEWLWYDTSRALLANSSTPVLPFPVGTSMLSLTVRDDAGHHHSDVTNVTVNSHLVSGAYCYYYKLPAHAVRASYFTIDQNIVVGLKPVHSVLLPVNFSLTAKQHLPSVIRDHPFQLRCTMHFPPADPRTHKLHIEHQGQLRVLAQSSNSANIAYQTVFATPDQTLQTSTVDLTVPPQGTHLQIWYLHTSPTAPHLRILAGLEHVLHDLSAQLPVVHFIKPPNSTLSGGGLATVHGSGFWNGAIVYFDKVAIKRIDQRSDHATLTVKVPVSSTSKIVSVHVGNRLGSSNQITFKYSENALSPILFEEHPLQHASKNEIFHIERITNVKWGPDHRLYLSSLDSVVHSVTVSRQLTVSDFCESRSLGRGRAIIGLAFNPADDDVVLYASSSIIFWGNYLDKKGVLGPVPWANGQVHRLAPGHDGSCLGVIGQPIITGLPVSNHDHAVNGMVFDDDGRLIIQVGSATNAGVSDEKVGGLDETPLSAASLIADVNQIGFDGHMVYSSDKPAFAKIVSGDVKVYAPGWRSSFEITTHSNGFIYATDNGANPQFGNRSTSCDSEAPISPYNSDDRLVKVIQGKYGGHPNRNRARDDPVQCVWRSPFGKATDEYNAPIATLQSSTDGLIEYTADLFEGQMKGNLLASKYSSNDKNDEGRLYRIHLNHQGNLRGKVESLWEASGLSIVMTPWGDLISPRVYDKNVLALKAMYRNDKVGRIVAVTPFRGPRRGGNVVLVTGWKLGQGSIALFGGQACTGYRYIDDDSFKCLVPSGSGGTSVRVDIRLANGTVVPSSGGFDYRYMRI